MPGTTVMATNLDSIWFERINESRAVTIPAVFLLAADQVMRQALLSGASLHVQHHTPNLDDLCWTAYLSSPQEIIEGSGDTPWAALLSLAQQVEGG